MEPFEPKEDQPQPSTESAVTPEQSFDSAPAPDPQLPENAPSSTPEPASALPQSELTAAAAQEEPAAAPLAPGQSIAPAETTDTPAPSLEESVPAAPSQEPAPAPVPPAPVEETPDLPPQPVDFNRRPFVPPPPELLKKPSHKKRNILIAAFSLILLGGVGAYFGYFVPNKPENMWKTALVNTGKGYDKLIAYGEEAKDVPGWAQEGEFSFKGGLVADGSFKGESSGNTSKLSGSVSAMGAKVGLDLRTFPSASATPDMYFKVDGLEGLGDLFGGGDPAVQSALNGLNNQWYVIDHTLFDQFGSSPTEQTITAEDMIAFLKAASVTTKKYIFTSNTDQAALTIKQKVGRETRDGRSVYHYKVGTDKKKLEAYSVELCKDLKSSKIGQTITESAGEDIFDCEGKNAGGDKKVDAAGVDKLLKASDLEKKSGEMTVDAWVDTKTKLISSVRFSDSKETKNFIEISQNYTGGDTMPFKLTYHDETDGNISDIKLNASVNTKSNALSLDGTFDSVDTSNRDNNTKGTFKFTMQPTKASVEVERPADAKNIIQLLNDLGFGQLFSGEGGGLLGGGQAQSQDVERKNSLTMLAASLEESAANTNGTYPTLSQVNSKQWRTSYDIDDATLTDPDGSSSQLLATASKGQYGYTPKGVDGQDCNNTTVRCRGYILTAVLSNGEVYKIES